MDSDNDISNPTTDTRILYFSTTLELIMPITPIDLPFTKLLMHMSFFKGRDDQKIFV